MLARLTSIVVDSWVLAMGDFIDRLAADWNEIGRTFLPQGSELGAVTALEPYLSDRHHYGQTVIGVTFSSGIKVYYKPRRLGIDHAFADFLNWFNEQEPSYPLRGLTIIERTGYGWVESAETVSMESETEAHSFYRRVGKLLCIMHALQGTDFHFENIVANGEHPILVDIETICHPRTLLYSDINNDPTAYGAVERFILAGLIGTGMLPQWLFGPDGECFDISGIGGVLLQQTSFTYARWEDVNSDAMALRIEKLSRVPKVNVPRINTKTIDPFDYIDDIVEGFESAYRCITAHRDRLLDMEHGPLAGVMQQEVRFVLRPTSVYGEIINHTLQPQFLYNDATRKETLVELKQSFPHHPSGCFDLLLKEELIAVDRLDIPHFVIRPIDCEISGLTSGTPAYCLIESGCDSVKARLQSFSLRMLEQNSMLIRRCFQARTVPISHREKQSAFSSGGNLQEVTPITTEQAVALASIIATELERHAIYGNDGGASWVSTELAIGSDRFCLKPMGFDLYSGSAGVSLFLAALNHARGDSHFHQLALAALQPIQLAVRDGTLAALTGSMGIGGFTGIGSVVYALTQASRFLDDTGLLNDALHVAAFINDAQINRAHSLDIIGGVAGAAVALATLYQVTESPLVLRQATVAALRLLKHDLKTEPKMLSGFSHGAAGIANALTAVAQASNNAAFSTAASRYLNYERTLYSPETQNWRDLRHDQTSGHKYSSSWCHGAPGIGLGRLRLAALHQPAEGNILSEIDTALETTAKHCPRNVDNLCCGNFGQLDLLLEAGQQLKRPDLTLLARKITAVLTQRAAQEGAFHLITKLPRGVFNPGLMQGISGIGYALLRTSEPEGIPSVLSLSLD